MRLLVFLGLIFSLVVCDSSGGQAKLEQQLEELRLLPSGRVQPLPSYAKLTPASYTQTDRDPFEPGSDLITPQPTQAATERTLQPLENYDLGSLSLRGIMQKGPQALALVLTPDGQLVRVKIGDYLGKNNGQVIHIDTQQLVLKETLPLGAHWVEQEKILHLAK